MLLTCSLASCGRAQGTPDRDLGDLVIAAPDRNGPVELVRAAKDPVELGRALARPYGLAVAALGRHTATVKLATTTTEPGGAATTLTESSTLELGEGASFHGLYESSADLGREVIYVDAPTGGGMFLRPRYQRWHGRAPESPEEPAHIRDSFVDATAATWDLIEPAAELTDRGATTVAGRAGRRIVITQAPKPAPNPPERPTQRKWRESRVIEGVGGEIVLDADSGVLLAAKLAGKVSFTRDGQRYSLTVQLESTVSGLGTAVPIVAPDPAEVVATPERLREVDDRDQLLQGLAPPIHKGPAGSTTP